MDGCDTGIGEILVLADASNIPGRKKDGVLGMSGDDDYEKNNKEPRRAWAVRQRQYPFLRDRIHYNSATISVALWCWLRASYFRGCCCCHCLFVFGVNSRLCADPSSGSSAKGDFSKRIGLQSKWVLQKRGACPACPSNEQQQHGGACIWKRILQNLELEPDGDELWRNSDNNKRIKKIAVSLLLLPYHISQKCATWRRSAVEQT